MGGVIFRKYIGYMFLGVCHVYVFGNHLTHDINMSNARSWAVCLSTLLLRLPPQHAIELLEGTSFIGICVVCLQVQAAQNLIRQIAFEHRIRDLSAGGVGH